MDKRDAINSDRTVYKFPALPSKSSFLILEILSGRETQPISCRHHLADWNNPPDYEAISYAWGDTSRQVSIICDDKLLYVTPSLRDGLQRMRHEDRSRFVWADAANIDQSDLKVREQQVSNMFLIYAKATRVIIWLGPDENDFTTMAFAAMREIASACCDHSNVSIDQLESHDDLWLLAPMQPVTSLRCNHPRSWQALSWFLCRPWFSRLWVFQEVNAGRSALVVCASSEIDWNIVALAASYVRKHDSVQMNGGLRDSYYANAYIMRNRAFHSKFSVPQFLEWGRRFECSNPLDRIYSLLGMPPFARLDPPIRADYTKTRRQLFEELSARCLCELGMVDVLSLVHHSNDVDTEVDFPSWVPEWDRKRAWSTMNSDINWSWSSAGNLTSCAEVDLVTSVLTIEGLIVDVIEQQEDLNIREWFDEEDVAPTIHPILEKWRSEHVQLTTYLNGEKTIDVYAQVLTTGTTTLVRKVSESRERFLADFSSYVAHLMETRNESKEYLPKLKKQALSGEWRNFKHRALAQSKNRSMFTSSKGYMGLGPRSLRPKDVIVVLFGGKLPYILRPIEHGRFRFVGEAYVHGIMEGEALKPFLNQQIQSTKFRLR